MSRVSVSLTIPGPLSQGKSVEWKLPHQIPTVQNYRVPSRRGNQLNGNPVTIARVLLQTTRPLSQGKSVEWKLPRNRRNGIQVILGPLSQGKSVEWKLSPKIVLMLKYVQVPSRRGNQLNGNSRQGRSRDKKNRLSPLAGEIS